MSSDKISAMLSRAFDSGQSVCGDLKDQVIAEILQDFNVKECESLLRPWKVEELNQMPDGSIFHHVSKGRGWIVSRADGSKYMQFRSGMMFGFSSDNDPWNQPMKLIEMGK